MKLYKNEVGALNVLLMPLIVASILFFATFGFAVWSYMGMVDYRDNVDQKIQTAVNVAVEKNSTDKDNEFLEKEKNPLKTYKGPAVLGSISFDYPKTWSGYYVEKDKDMYLIMQQNLVNGDQNTYYHLRVDVANTSYDSNMKSYEGSLKKGIISAKPFRLAKLPDILGTRFDGEVQNGVKGSTILIPSREKTIIISTYNEQAVNDLNNIVLPSFTFTP